MHYHPPLKKCWGYASPHPPRDVRPWPEEFIFWIDYLFISLFIFFFKLFFGPFICYGVGFISSFVQFFFLSSSIM